MNDKQDFLDFLNMRLSSNDSSVVELDDGSGFCFYIKNENKLILQDSLTPSMEFIEIIKDETLKRFGEPMQANNTNRLFWVNHEKGHTNDLANESEQTYLNTINKDNKQ